MKHPTPEPLIRIAESQMFSVPKSTEAVSNWIEGHPVADQIHLFTAAGMASNCAAYHMNRLLNAPPLYQKLARLIAASFSAFSLGNWTWADNHKDAADQLVFEFMPSGSGFDSGTQIDWNSQEAWFQNHKKVDRIYMRTSFHHMNEAGMYTHWTHHALTITAAFDGFDMHMTKGRADEGFMDYAQDSFNDALLSKKFDWNEWVLNSWELAGVFETEEEKASD